VHKGCALALRGGGLGVSSQDRGVCKERQDVGRAQENVEALQQQQADLEAEFKAEAESQYFRARSP